MTIKYIITQINDNIIYSKYNNNGCLSLNIVDKSSLVGNIYIGRVENVVKIRTGEVGYDALQGEDDIK